MATLTTTSMASPVGTYDHHDDHDSWDISQDIREKSGIATDFSDSFLGIDDADRSALSERRKASSASTTASHDRGHTMRSPMVDDGTFGDGSSTHNPHARAQSRASERKSRSDRHAEATSLSSSAPRAEDKWIHRDKLAKIENAELQAAGIVLPKPRAVSRRRDRSEHSYHRAEDTTASSRKNSMSMAVDSKLSETPGSAWDLRLPEEIMEEGSGSYWESPSASGKSSRIPVAKISPAPISNDFIDRDMPMGRSKSHEPDSDPLRKPRSRSNSTRTNNELSSSMSGSGATSSSVPPPNKRGTDSSSPRKVSATRKSSVPPRRSTSRPKTRSRKESSATQLSVRSGELSTSSSSKQPEGDPPWMVSAYKPDPRLPPEEQLLPTVARRLQQEKWEKEGKFGNVYDKDFRPLNDDGFIKPPVAPEPEAEPQAAAEEPAPETLDEPIKLDQWPLKTTSDVPRSPTVRSYSTMPKINDQVPGSPGGMPRGPGTPRSPRPDTAQQHPQSPQQQQQQQPQEPQHMQPQISHQQDQHQQNQQSLAQLEKDKDAGCGCCVVM